MPNRHSTKWPTVILEGMACGLTTMSGLTPTRRKRKRKRKSEKCRLRNKKEKLKLMKEKRKMKNEEYDTEKSKCWRENNDKIKTKEKGWRNWIV